MDDRSFSDVLNSVAKSIELYADRSAFFIDGESYTYKVFGEKISGIRASLRNRDSESYREKW